MRDLLKSDFMQRWLWLCPALGVVLAAVVLLLFGFTLQVALLAALLLVCPAIFVWAAMTFIGDLRGERMARRRLGAAAATALAADSRFRFHREASADLAIRPGELFAVLDDHRSLSGHMEKPSLMMAGATMKIETDDRHGQALGSRISLRGQVLGMALAVDEVVVHYEPPWRKAWETIGQPRLLVIGAYRMGFEIASRTDQRTESAGLRVWIDYDLPTGMLTRLLGRALGRIYADWCTGQMVRDASATFSRGRPAATV